MEAAAADMDFTALSRRELQALCKLNGVRANMTNLAMADALHALASVDGIDQIGTTLCLPTPGKSAMKSVLRAAADQQQQGSPLPGGRRVSVKSPEAMRMDGEDEVKRDLVVKEIVRTPGVALRGTSRRPRAPISTPAAGTLRRSQRSAARKAAAAVEVQVSTRKTAKSNMVIDLGQDEEDAVVVREQEVEPKDTGVVTKLLDEPEQGEEGVSSVAAIESADKSCDNSKVEGSVEELTKPQEGAAIGEEQRLVKAEKFPMEDSPILGVFSKVAPEPAMKNVENASTEDDEGFGNWSPVLELPDEINSASEAKEDAAVGVPKEDAFSPIVEAADTPNKMISAAVTEKEVAANEFPHADPTDDESAEEHDLNGKSSDEADLTEESSEEDDLDEEDDFSADLSSEFDSVDDFSDAETESNNSPLALEGIRAVALSSAAKTDDSAITEEIVSNEGDEVSQHIETIIESLEKVTITEVKNEECAKEKKQQKVGKEMSLRKLKSAYKESIIAAKEGKKLSIDADEGSRVALAELDDNVKC